MLQARIDTKILKDFIDGIVPITTECRLHITETGIYTIAVSASGVSMVKSACSKEMFHDYTATECVIGISVTKLKPSIGAITSKECSIEYTESSGTLVICDNKNKYTMRTFAEETLQSDPKKHPEEFFEALPTHLCIEGTELATSIKNATLAGDKAVFDYKMDTNTLTVSFHEDLESMTSILDPSNIDVIKGSDSRTILPSEYLKPLGSIISRTEIINLHMGTDVPMCFHMLIDDAINTTYVVAPRLEV